MSIGAAVSGAIIYGRASHKSHVSVTGQIERSTAWAEREGWPILAVHRDDGISASRYAKAKARPEWQDTMAAIVANPGAVLLLWEISRASRDRTVYAKLIATCLAADVLIGIDGKIHNPADPDDGFMLDLMAALSVRESAVISKRVNVTIRSQAAAGKPHGRLPYGYQRTYSSTTGKLLEQIPYPPEAAIIRELADRVLRGEKLYALAAELNERGVPWRHGRRSGSAQLRRRHDRWYPDQIKRLLISPTYVGQRTFHDQLTPGTWPPILTFEQHQRLVALLTDPARGSQRDSTVKHLLTGLIECGVCGSPCRVIKNRGSLSYACLQEFCVSRLESALDEYIETYMVELVQDPHVLESLIDPDDSDVTAAAFELRELEAQLRSYQKAAGRKDGISAASFLVIEAELLPQIEDARRRATPTHVSSVVLDLARAPNPAERWADLGIPQKREAIRAFIHIRLHRTPYRNRRFDRSTVEIIDKRGMP